MVNELTIRNGSKRYFLEPLFLAANGLIQPVQLNIVAV